MTNSRCGRTLILLGLVGLLFLGEDALADEHNRVIIRAVKPYDRLVSAVRDLGGQIHHRFENVDAVAVSVPEEGMAQLAAMAGVSAVMKDLIVEVPKPIERVAGSTDRGLVAPSLAAEATRVLDQPALDGVVAALPADYNFNNSLIGASTLHAQGKQGQDVIVAVIDSGTANAPVVAALSGTVIGGENLVPSDPVQSATSRRNGPHGTYVGSMIASHVVIELANTSALVQSLKIHSPSSVLEPCPNPPPTVTCGVPMIGSAPGAKVYAIKVFDSRGGGAPESRVLAAMDRAITLRHNFNRGMPSVPVAGTGTEDDPFKFDSLNIQVVNLSLGGATLFAGRDLEDQLTVNMLGEGITLVVAAGNDGFAAMTGSSPGTGFGALTVGAASTAVHERVLRDVQRGAQLGIGTAGTLFRPSAPTQTAFFSARGPTADGRLDPEVTANGFASFAQGTCRENAGCLAGTAQAPIDFVSGTSFSSPTAAGAAAVLRREAPWASAAQLRNALTQSADSTLLGDRSGPIDQGSGFINVANALATLQSGSVKSEFLPGRIPSREVRRNVADLGLRTVSFVDDRFFTHVESLLPGQVAQFFVQSSERTEKLSVTLRNITPEFAPAQQNQIFGDDLFVQVVDAPTSQAITRVSEIIKADQTFTVDHPQTGLVRVALQGDWTNAGRISTDLEIVRHQRQLTAPTAYGKVAQGDSIPIGVDVPVGTARLVFELSWKGNWSAYPTNDIDMVLVDPDGVSHSEGATLNSPERVVISNPAGVAWTAVIKGLVVNGSKDRFALRVTADDHPLGAATGK